MSMELLQNHKYKSDELTISYLYEVKSQMESVIELCREGEISVHDVEHIISGEFFEAHGVLYDLEQKPTENICHSMSDLAIQQEEINENKKMTASVFDYIAFLEKTEKEELPEIIKSDGYQQKRKSKMKTQSNIEQEKEELQEFFNGTDTDQEFNKRMNELENIYTPKREILQKSKKKFYGVLDAYIQGTLTKEKALLLLQSKHQQLSEEIINMSRKGSFIEIDYEDGKGYMPEEFMKIADEVNYYYGITKNNIENAEGNPDIKFENFSSPAVKRVAKSVSASFDKYFGTAEKKESQPEQETQSIEKTSSTQCSEKVLKSKQETTPPMQGIEPSAPESDADSISSDYPIKNFPKGVDDDDKNILEKLAKAHLIKNELSPNGKYDMAKRRLCKKIVRFLIANGFNDTWGGIFMNKYINHDIERSSVVNYFNECPKDMPLKSV